ncbi:MAG: sensor histidine kinase, partial [Atopobiaceae bacterium]|nr:sensor histidine kinase [Atopobiaceae bacterium]
WVASFCAAAGYTAQNFATSINDLIWLMSRAEQSTSAVMLYIASMWAIAALIFAITWWALIRRVHLGGLTVIESRPMMVMLLGVALFCIYFDLVNKVLIPGFGVRLFYIVLLRFTHGASCIFLLWVQYELLYRQRLQMDVAAIEHIRATEAKQYELSRENIEAINIKCHDIRHHIRQLEHGETSIDRAVLDDIVREVAIYDSTVRTGNDALDTILTEKSMLCKRQGITLSCIADGEILDFIPPVELYSLFGNALDNAMEAVNQVADAHRRSIGLVVRENMGMALIHVENVFDGEVSFEGGLPRTTKSDHFNHGFGVKSMKMTVEAHGGTLATSARDGVFHLNILIPIPMQN